ncbi:Calcium-channel protein cch1 [Erysiphe neolycopersici]|uniref:Calcium-channel protein CCH1 n=1 Tax=Erysiphe neolycopersici TaxID=212602 RepID=A0A420HND3_9PEZI|nr:Calcium-channel protein cch1 [Erysiphe neolycopersici]
MSKYTILNIIHSRLRRWHRSMPTKRTKNSSTPSLTPLQTIPLRDLALPTQSSDENTDRERSQLIRERSLLRVSSRLRPLSCGSGKSRYEKIQETSPGIEKSPNSEEIPKNAIETYDEETPKYTVSRSNVAIESQQSPSFVGLVVPKNDGSSSARILTPPFENDDSEFNQKRNHHGIDSASIFGANESERIPLTRSGSANQEKNAETSLKEYQPYEKPRVRFQNVNFSNSRKNRRRIKLDDVPADINTDTEAGQWPDMPPSSNGYRRSHLASRAPSNATDALSRAGSIMRAMSQRVVNISGETEMIEATAQLEASRQESILSTESKEIPPPKNDESGSSYKSNNKGKSIESEIIPPTHLPTAPIEKAIRFFGGIQSNQDDINQPIMTLPNPLRGKTLGYFSQESQVRNMLCNLLVYPLTEPIILILIIAQVILLAIESSQSVYEHPRIGRWGASPIDYALLILFVIFTIELAARIIVSGFIFNATEYSTQINHKPLAIKFLTKFLRVFRKDKNFSNKLNRPSKISETEHRSLTSIQTGLIKTVEQAQRLQLARRAFLRHSFNRLDFVAVCAFWMTFILCITGIEDMYHFYIFRMLSCLRILRLLALTNGTSIILRSLKKAAPLLVKVSFLIGFFWLLFAIIGVQSFKSSLDRQCVWIDPSDPTNLTGSAYINSFQYCGGQHNINTGAHDPWVIGPLGDLSPGAESPKGFLCPRGSYCLQLPKDQLPYNGTISFDNIFQSLELVFVVMTANTFSDIMYNTMNSDYLASAIYFAGGIIIMMFWLLNLLIAVITSSFQIIREEGKTSAFASQAKIVQARGEDLKVNKYTKKYTSSLKAWFDTKNWLWVALIAYDILCQTFRTSNMSQTLAQFIDTSQTIVTLFLLFEIFIRFIVDWRKFGQSKRNLVDLSLALTTTIMLIPPIRNSDKLYAWLTIFQISRVYRLIMALPVTKSLIMLVLGNSSGIGNLILFVFLITFLVSIFAVQLFRGELTSEDAYGNTIQVTFFTNWNAFLGMYQILSSENWTDPLYNLTSFSSVHNTAWIAAAFVIGWFILGNFILINMFIAVIQENFDVSEDEKRMHQVKAFLNRKELGGSSSHLSLSTVLRLGRPRSKKDPLDYGPATMEMLLKDAVVKDFLDDEIKEGQILAYHKTTSMDISVSSHKNESSLWQKIKNNLQNKEPNPFYSHTQFSGASTNANESADARTMAKEVVSATTQRKRAQREYLVRYPNFNTSLYIFKPENPVRRLCQKIVGPGRGSERFNGVEPNRVVWYTFTAIIYAAIIAMVLIACVTTPLYEREYLKTHKYNSQNWILLSDTGFAVLFTLEALIKAIADGIYWTPNAYFRSSWGLIDAVVLITLWINVITSFTNNSNISRAVGAFKALRALRLLNVSESTRDTFHSLVIVAGWKIVSAAFVSLSLLVPFAIYGLNLFNGKMLSCNDTDPSNIKYLSDCFGEYYSTPYSSDWPILAPRVISNPFFDFDNFGSSLFILFQIVSQEGWVDVMWAAQSIIGRGIQPQPYSSQENAIFFVIFNLLATVFVLTLFISVFMRNYTEQTGVAFLTAEQRSWLELRKLLRQVYPSKRQSTTGVNNFKTWCYTKAVQKRGKWYKIVSTMLVLHLIFLLVEYYPEPSWWDQTRNYIFFAFTLFFLANVIIRIIGLGWARFRRSLWEMYSLLIVFGTLGTTILYLLQLKSQVVIQLHKFFLVMIVLLLIPRNDALDQLFKTAAASVTNIGNLVATWLVLFLVYAIALTQIFGLTRFGPHEDNNLNFRTVPKALILLFRMSCGESWNAIMEDYATILPPLCVSVPNFFDSDCGSSRWARVLFITWNILSMYIFTSLFVSLIYESFSYVYQHSSGLNKVSREEIRRFKEAWATFDPNGTGYISKEQFPRLLKKLSGVFAMRIYPPEHSIHRILEDVRQKSAGEITTTTGKYSEVNLKELNRRISMIDKEAVKRARNQYSMFFEEIMVSADVDRGISFTTILMVLAHYRVIRDNKSLKLEEFLRRRARLQRVEEEVRRRIVLGFFDTMYWSRKFHQHLESLKFRQVVDLSKQGPSIYVNNEEIYKQKIGNAQSSVPISQDQTNPYSNLSDFNLDGGARRRRSVSRGNMATSPVLLPQHSPSTAVTTGFALENCDIGGSSCSSRRGSSVSTENVLDIIDDSAWGESVRRSFILRRSS